jgi:large repetitive protein
MRWSASWQTLVSANSVPINNPGTFVGGVFGKVLINPDGSFGYIPDLTKPAVSTLPVGQSLQDIFTYVVSDGELTSTATLTITIQGVNSPPVAIADTGSVTEDSPINGIGNVLTNDSDPEAATKTVTKVNGLVAKVGVSVQGLFGEFIINADGSFVYVLDNANPTVNGKNDGETLTDEMIYTVSDGVSSADAKLTVTINGKNG